MLMLGELPTWKPTRLQRQCRILHCGIAALPGTKRPHRTADSLVSSANFWQYDTNGFLCLAQRPGTALAAGAPLGNGICQGLLSIGFLVQPGSLIIKPPSNPFTSTVWQHYSTLASTGGWLTGHGPAVLDITPPPGNLSLSFTASLNTGRAESAGTERWTTASGNVSREEIFTAFTINTTDGNYEAGVQYNLELWQSGNQGSTLNLYGSSFQISAFSTMVVMVATLPGINRAAIMGTWVLPPDSDGTFDGSVNFTSQFFVPLGQTAYVENDFMNNQQYDTNSLGLPGSVTGIGPLSTYFLTSTDVTAGYCSVQAS
jgi:hypothetical protein